MSIFPRHRARHIHHIRSPHPHITLAPAALPPTVRAISFSLFPIPSSLTLCLEGVLCLASAGIFSITILGCRSQSVWVTAPAHKSPAEPLRRRRFSECTARGFGTEHRRVLGKLLKTCLLATGAVHPTNPPEMRGVGSPTTRIRPPKQSHSTQTGSAGGNRTMLGMAPKGGKLPTF